MSYGVSEEEISTYNCGHCKWHRKDAQGWVCMNQESDCYGCDTEYNDFCADLERRDQVNGNM